MLEETKDYYPFTNSEASSVLSRIAFYLYSINARGCTYSGLEGGSPTLWLKYLNYCRGKMFELGEDLDLDNLKLN